MKNKGGGEEQVKHANQCACTRFRRNRSTHLFIIKRRIQVLNSTSYKIVEKTELTELQSESFVVSRKQKIRNRIFKM